MAANYNVGVQAAKQVVISCCLIFSLLRCFITQIFRYSWHGRHVMMLLYFWVLICHFFFLSQTFIWYLTRIYRYSCTDDKTTCYDVAALLDLAGKFHLMTFYFHFACDGMCTACVEYRILSSHHYKQFLQRSKRHGINIP